jgi:hypothetical protein
MSAVMGIVKSAPTLLLLSMALTFVIMMGVQMFYYTMVLTPRVPYPAIAYSMAIAIGLVFQLARLSFGVAGAWEFGIGYVGKGMAGLLFSVALTVFESFEIAEMSDVWTRNDAEFRSTLNMILQAVLWLGFGLELRLALNVAGSLKPLHTDNRKDTHTDDRMGRDGGAESPFFKANGRAKIADTQ